MMRQGDVGLIGWLKDFAHGIALAWMGAWSWQKIYKLERTQNQRLLSRFPKTIEFKVVQPQLTEKILKQAWEELKMGGPVREWDQAEMFPDHEHYKVIGHHYNNGVWTGSQIEWRAK